MAGIRERGLVGVLAALGVDVVVCCAVSRCVQVELKASGIRVLKHICGAVDEVLAAFLQDRLADEAFRMPGARGPAEPVGGKARDAVSIPVRKESSLISPSQ